MYKVEFTLRALKDFQKITPENQLKIRQAVRELGVAPMDYPGLKRIQGGPKNRFRIRVGDYRVVFDCEQKIQILLVLRVGHRKGIYRDF